MVYVSGRWVRVPVSGNTGVPGASSCTAITASPCGLTPKTAHVSSRRIDKVFHLSNCPMSTRIENRQNDREIDGDCQEKDRSLSHLYMPWGSGAGEAHLLSPGQPEWHNY